MTRFFLMLILIFYFNPPAWAKGDHPDAAPPFSPIQTHWTLFDGMQYLRDDRVLSEPELNSVIRSLKDQQATELLVKGESDGTWGGFLVGGSIVASILILFLPGSHFQLLGLNVAAPYLPVAAPGTVFGIVGGFLESQANTEKYAAVQRYNRLTKQDEALTWNFSPQKNGVGLNMGYAF
jgi:hypothetical protein